MTDDPCTPDGFSDPANWHPIEEHPYLNDPPKVTPMPDVDRSDTLHTRIAAALREALLSEIGGSIDGVDNIYVGDETVHLVILADAVIKEIGLRQEWAVADADGDHVYVGSVEENADRYTIQPGDHKEIRYVTDWEIVND